MPHQQSKTSIVTTKPHKPRHHIRPKIVRSMKQSPNKSTLSNTQRDIVVQIKDLHRRHQPLNITAIKREHPGLIASVYQIKPFWGWKQALEAAGIDYADIKVHLSDYVTCRICGRELRHLISHLPRLHEVKVAQYQKDYPSEALFSESTLAHFRESSQGKYHSPQPWEPLWSPEYTLDLLAHLHRNGLPVNMAALKNVNNMLPLQCVKYFGSFDEALRKIGLDPAKIRKHTEGIARPKQEVIDLIKKRHAQGKSLSLTTTYAEMGQMPGFRAAIHTHFGSWHNALKAAGFEYGCKWLRKYDTRQEVLRAIRSRRQKKQPLSWAGLFTGPHRDPALYKNGARLFGSWQKTIRAAGLSFKSTSKQRLKYPNKQAVIKEIRRREKIGEPVSSRRGYLIDHTLIRAIQRFYGSCPQAMKAAGISKKARRRSR